MALTLRLLLLVFVLGVLPAAAQENGGRRAVPRLPRDSVGRAVLQEAARTGGLKILVSVDDRRLWLINGRDTLLHAPAAVGVGKDFVFEGRRFTFKTPKGRRRVLAKRAEPVWTVPEWHYLEKATNKGLQVVRIDPKLKYELGDGTFIDVRGDSVGRLNRFGNWWPFSQDFEIIFDGKIFVPPLNTIQRRVTNALGPYKLDMGDGYLIHGTHLYNEQSIGEAASHGCIRLRNDDLRRLFAQAPTGTPIFIF